MKETTSLVSDLPASLLSEDSLLKAIKKMQRNLAKIRVTKLEECCFDLEQKIGLDNAENNKDYIKDKSTIDQIKYLLSSKRTQNLYKLKQFSLFAVPGTTIFSLILYYTQISTISANYHGVAYLSIIAIGYSWILGILNVTHNQIINRKIEPIFDLPQKILKSPQNLNNLCQFWLMECGIPEIEQKIIKIGEQAAEWDNVASELKTYIGIALKNNRLDLANEAQNSKFKLEDMKQELLAKKDHLKQVKERLLELKIELIDADKKLDGYQELQKIQSKVNGLESSINNSMKETALLLSQIKQVADIALDTSLYQNPSLDAQQFIEQVENNTKKIAQLTAAQ